MPKKYIIESTTPGFPALEKALFVANDKIGWKDLCAFLVNWTNQHQPKGNPYTLKSYLKP